MKPTITKLITLALCAAALTACGSGGDAGTAVATPKHFTYPAGYYVASERGPLGRWETVTTTGAFRAYTSSRFTPGDELTINYTTDGADVVLWSGLKSTAGRIERVEL